MVTPSIKTRVDAILAEAREAEAKVRLRQQLEDHLSDPNRQSNDGEWMQLTDQLIPAGFTTQDLLKLYEWMFDEKLPKRMFWRGNDILNHMHMKRREILHARTEQAAAKNATT